MTLSGDLPEKRGETQPDGSVEGCNCGYCQDTRKVALVAELHKRISNTPACNKCHDRKYCKELKLCSQLN